MRASLKKTQSQIETALLNVGFTHLGARDYKPRGSPSGKEILSHVTVSKIIKETRKEKQNATQSHYKTIN